MRRLLMFTLPFALASCNAPTAFYQTLSGILQFNPLRQNYFAVGDTLTLTGTLGGPHGGLVVKIGGVVAPIVEFGERADTVSGGPGVTYNGTQDSARVIVTQAMGIGANRKVTGTLHGVEREAGLVFISLTRPLPARSDTLSYDSVAVSFTAPLSGGDTLVARGDNGDGRVYVLCGDTLELWAHGVRSVLHAGLEDQYAPFHNIGASNAANAVMAVDEAGRYLYASLVTSDTTAASATNFIFRLIKIDLQSYTVVTLNRTLFPMDQTQVTPAYASGLTMTGSVGSVFLMPLSQIFPGADGTIYFVADGLSMQQNGAVWGSVYNYCGSYSQNLGFDSAIGKIDQTGNVTYLIKPVGCGLVLATTAGPQDLLPTLNTTHDWSWVDVIDPDSGVAYASGTGTSISGVQVPPAWANFAYDLKRQRVIGQLAPPPTGVEDFGPSNTVNGPFVAVDGPFAVLGLVRGGGHRAWGYAIKNDGKSAVGYDPSIVIIDFDAQLVSPYVALGAFLQQPSFLNQNWAGYQLLIVNHTSRGDPLVAAMSGYGSSQVQAPAAAYASASRVARRR